MNTGERHAPLAMDGDTFRALGHRLVEQIKVLAGDATSSIKVVLLNVQPAPADGRLRGYGSFKRDEIMAGLTNAGRSVQRRR